VAFGWQALLSCDMAGQLSLAVGDVAFDGGAERLSLVVGDMPDVTCPHPSMRGGAVRGNST
jgi:hypothetical protein